MCDQDRPKPTRTFRSHKKQRRQSSGVSRAAKAQLPSCFGLALASSNAVKSAGRGYHSALPNHPERPEIHPEDLIEERCTWNQLHLAIKAVHREEERDILASRFQPRRAASAPPNLTSQQRQNRRGIKRSVEDHHANDAAAPPNVCKRRKHNNRDTSQRVNKKTCCIEAKPRDKDVGNAATPPNNATQTIGSRQGTAQLQRQGNLQKNSGFNAHEAHDEVQQSLRSLDIDTRIAKLEIRVQMMKRQSKALVQRIPF